MSTPPARRATFHDVFAVREFRALWLSYVLSAGGDRLALVALTLLVYDRTKSPLLAAVAFAAGTLPYLFGALFLSGMADRFPRRRSWSSATWCGRLLVGAMLLPRMPLVALIVLLYAVTPSSRRSTPRARRSSATWSRASATRWRPRCSSRRSA